MGKCTSSKRPTRPVDLCVPTGHLWERSKNPTPVLAAFQANHVVAGVSDCCSGIAAHKLLTQGPRAELASALFARALALHRLRLLHLKHLSCFRSGRQSDRCRVKSIGAAPW